MMKAGFRIYGMKDVQRRLVVAVEKAHKLAQVGVSTACIHLEKSIKRKLQQGPRHGGIHSGYGRQYRVPGTKRAWHTASAPGEPPAILFGRLRASITWNIKNREKTKVYTYSGGSGVATIPATGTSKLSVIGLVGTNVEYAKALEFGYAPRNLEPRPFMLPTLKEQQKAISVILRETLRKL